MHIRQLTADDAAMFYPFRLLSLRESPHAFLRSYEEYSRETLDNVAQRFRQQAFADIDLFDFSKTARMIEAGCAARDQYLAHPRPNTIRPLAAIGAPAASTQRMPRGGRPLRE